MLEFAYPHIGSMPLTAIEPPDILTALRTLDRQARDDAPAEGADLGGVPVRDPDRPRDDGPVSRSAGRLEAEAADQNDGAWKVTGAHLGVDRGPAETSLFLHLGKSEQLFTHGKLSQR
ncbi:MAG TPA: hypothetical protein VJM11_00630, partial [Nevskiaceae bacterium]|nr:hypothetical protein [Nevskiaceae bacterium]